MRSRGGTDLADDLMLEPSFASSQVIDYFLTTAHHSVSRGSGRRPKVGVDFDPRAPKRSAEQAGVSGELRFPGRVNKLHRPVTGSRHLTRSWVCVSSTTTDIGYAGPRADPLEERAPASAEQ